MILHYSENCFPLQNVKPPGHITVQVHASVSAFEPWLAQLSSSPSAVSVDWSALLTGDRLALSGISLVLTTLYFLKVCAYPSNLFRVFTRWYLLQPMHALDRAILNPLTHDRHVATHAVTASHSMPWT